MILTPVHRSAVVFKRRMITLTRSVMVKSVAHEFVEIKSVSDRST